VKRILAAVLAVVLLAGCQREADMASYNVSVAADQFEVMRRVVFFNGITDTYLLAIEGLCSLGNNDDAGELTVTCKTGPSAYKKHFLGLSDNVSYFVEQMEAAKVDTFHYRVTFRPSTIIPDLDVR
jgi:hypothetical protein